MATSVRSSFVGSTSLASSIPKFVEPRFSRTLRVVSQCGHSIATRGSEGSVAKPEGEVSRFLDTGIEKQAELWWAPLFNVSPDEQWSNLLSKPSKKAKPAEQRIIRTAGSPGVIPPKSAAAAIAIPDIIDSTKSNDRQRSSSNKVAFTPEKARALRKSMRASETWHDGWYHSAIATRLAEPVD